MPSVPTRTGLTPAGSIQLPGSNTGPAYEDAKHIFGVGDARNRTPRAVERTVPFQFLCMTLTIVWYALSGHHPDIVAEHRARAPWYLSKTNPSTADMLAKLRRVIIAAQYRPRQDHTPHTSGNHPGAAGIGRPPNSKPPKSR